MAVCMEEVLDYLDEQLVCRKAENMESLMEILHDAYANFQRDDSKKVEALFSGLRDLWDPLTEETVDEMFSLVCDICAESEVISFAQGVRVGMLLMTEVNNV